MAAEDHTVAASARFGQTAAALWGTQGIPLQEVPPPEWLTNRAKSTSMSLPLPVHTDPRWTFEQDGFDKDLFFKEAKATEDNISVLRNRFDRYASKLNGERIVSLQDFQTINQNFQICKLEDEVRFFRAMDQSRKDFLTFDDFLIGCAAANPQTPHILNSHTGLVRARFIFDFYNVSRSGVLDFEELASMMVDVRKNTPDENKDDGRQSCDDVFRHAHELGELSVVTLEVNGLNGWLCDIRVNTHWTGLQLRHRISRELHVPSDSQDLVVGGMSLGEADVLHKLLQELNIPVERSKIPISLVRRVQCDKWIGSCKPSPSASDNVAGLEKLVHVTFSSLYEALRSGGTLRGTSRLFRFKRSIMQPTKKVERGSANLGGA